MEVEIIRIGIMAIGKRRRTIITVAIIRRIAT